MYCGMWFNDIKCYILALKKQKPQIVVSNGHAVSRTTRHTDTTHQQT